MDIYIVFGSCGEYEDYNVWPVKAFFSEKNAKAYAEMAEFRARQIEATHGDQDDNEYDPPKTWRSAPVDYGYEAVEVGDSPTQEAMALEETDMLYTQVQLLRARSDHADKAMVNIIKALESALDVARNSI